MPPSSTGLDKVFGQVKEPPGVAAFNSGGNIGIIAFASVLIRTATIVAGVWVMINFILAGYTYITSQGDTGAHKKVQEKLTNSVLGLVLIVGSYTLTALISWLLFGDPGFILSPTIQSP